MYYYYKLKQPHKTTIIIMSIKITHQTQTKKGLRQKGYKLITGYDYLYINKTGTIYNFKNAKYIKLTKKNYAVIENSYLNVPKVILNKFARQPIKKGQITYIDGNKHNLDVNNIKYSCIYEPNTQSNKPTESNIMNAIRCYIEVDKKYTIKDTIKTRLYLKLIIDNRKFIECNSNMKNIEIFNTYIMGFTNNYHITAKKHNLSIRDCKIIVNNIFSLFINDILKELENGLLYIHEFRVNKTATELKREINEKLKERGLKLIPLRKKSKKEIIKDYKKHIEKLVSSLNGTFL